MIRIYLNNGKFKWVSIYTHLCDKYLSTYCIAVGTEMRYGTTGVWSFSLNLEPNYASDAKINKPFVTVVVAI